MKILFVGHLNEGQTSLMRMNVLKDLGHSVIPVNVQAAWAQAGWLSRRVQQAMNAGPIVSQFNDLVLRRAAESKPDLVWAEKQEHLRPDTLRKLKAGGARTLHFTPDPYFSLSWKRTALMDAALPLFDYLVTSKRYELADYHALGPTIIYMPLGFAYAIHRPLSPSARKASAEYDTDIGFVGGWEPRREEMLTLLAKTGARVSIRGYAWSHLSDGKWTPRRAQRLRMLAGNDEFRIAKNALLAASVAGGEVYSDEYAWALSGARISVGFLRTICPDQHTTRTFEIPACASMLLADRTGEHLEFFEEGREAEFFSSQEELVEKAKFYIGNDSARDKIARAGYHRATSSGYSYHDRVGAVMDQLN